jgi:hypothetical protein
MVGLHCGIVSRESGGSVCRPPGEANRTDKEANREDSSHCHLLGWHTYTLNWIPIEPDYFSSRCHSAGKRPTQEPGVLHAQMNGCPKLIPIDT